MEALHLLQRGNCPSCSIPVILSVGYSDIIGVASKLIALVLFQLQLVLSTLF